MEDRLLTTSQVAKRLNVTLRRVRALIEAGRLPSQQFGRDHLIKESDLKLVEYRRPGRPPKQAAQGVSETRAAAGGSSTGKSVSGKRTKK